MAFSVNTPVGDGSTKQFAVNFTNGIFSRDSVHVFVEDEVDGTGAQLERDFIWISDGTIELTGPAPAAGKVIEIRRIMNKNKPAVDFVDGEILTSETGDRGLDHLLNSIHELLDGYFPGGVAGREFAQFLKGVSVVGDIESSGSIQMGESDPSNPNAAVSFGAADARFVNVNGDTMEGNLHINPASAPTHPARKDQLDGEQNARQAADANLQAQISGAEPLEASAFSPISWHSQEIMNSVTIPDNVNAWSFGPTVSVASGQSVTIGEGSFWTIANGEGGSGSTVEPFDGTYNYGEIK